MIETMNLNRVDIVPESLEPGMLYYSELYGVAIHLCACGCVVQVVTPIGDGGWTLVVDDGAVTLSPSIGNFQIACKSHYFVRSGRVVWC